MVAFGHNYLGRPLLSAVILLSSKATLAQYTGSTSIVNGQAVWEGTPVATNPIGMPTLVYNCAKMPSICKNVAKRNPIVNGALVGGPIILNYDTNPAHSSARRAQNCPSNWKLKHPCPEPDQPPAVPAGFVTSDNEAIEHPRRLDPFLPVDQPGAYVIDAGDGTSSGMMWTCDEWPPASVIEGGKDLANPNAGDRTICAPWGTGGCDVDMNEFLRGRSTRSEQNFQASAHSFLRKKVGPISISEGIFTFYFQVVTDSKPKTSAAYVEWYISPSMSKKNAYSRRDISNSSSMLRTKASTSFLANGKKRTVLGLVKEDPPHAISIPKSDVFQGISPSQQNPQFGDSIPILDISTDYILTQGSRRGDQISFATFNQSMSKGLLIHAQDTALLAARATNSNKTQCEQGRPCLDGSCCDSDGYCGFRPEHCGAKCISNCNAQAMCGVNSPGGSKKCGLSLCCSFYGYCGARFPVDEAHCNDPQPGIAGLPANKSSDCQKEFGSCKIAATPSCSSDGGSASKGRKVAYYQSWNIRERACNRITPGQINATGLTHLFFAFASIDPGSFVVTPRDPADISVYTDFTALKTSLMQTWIAVGGFDFSNVGPTRTTWSDMCSSAANRAAFITSLASFMSKYGFQGVDLDWEYPGTSDRGGKDADTPNFVSLVKEMRASFGTKFGISLTLAPDYWYLRGFDPKAMESSVDFFGFMAYDLHGSWDADVKTLGSLVRPQTDIREIANDTIPLWFAGLDPAKINFGLATYGRGYTLASRTCTSYKCPFTGPSQPLPCTNFAGVASNTEIKNLIAQKGLTPQLMSDAMIKQITWDDQWIGYDDDETLALKLSWANSRCFGGSMIWSIDMNSGPGSGDTPDLPSNATADPGGTGGANGNHGATSQGQGIEGSAGSNTNDSNTSDSGMDIYIDPSIWNEKNPTIMCHPPCHFILPPLPISGAESTITPGSLVTTVVLNQNVRQTSVMSGVEVVENQISTSLVTTTIPIPPFQYSQLGFYGFNVTGTDVSSMTIIPNPSIDVPSFRLTPSSKSTATQTVTTTSSGAFITITPPPYPWKEDNAGIKPIPGPPPPPLPSAPSITFRQGDPGPICKSGCGHKCVVFCSNCGLFGCNDCGLFGCGSNNDQVNDDDIRPVDEIDDEEDEGERDDENEEEEKEDECQIETGGLGLQAGQGSDSGSGSGAGIGTGTGMGIGIGSGSGNGNENGTNATNGSVASSISSIDQELGNLFSSLFKPRPTTSSTISIAPAPPPPTPSPPPPPAPPSPNPDTEELKCYDRGSWITRGTAIGYINDFCGRSKAGGKVVSHNQYVRYDGIDTLGFVDTIISIQGLNNCEFTVDGPDPDQDCGRILRKILDKCDQTGTQYKQGGTVTSNCAIWRLDPGFIPESLIPPGLDNILDRRSLPHVS